MHIDRDGPAIYFAATQWRRQSETEWKFQNRYTRKGVVELEVHLGELPEIYFILFHRRLDVHELVSFWENHEEIYYDLSDADFEELENWLLVNELIPDEE